MTTKVRGSVLANTSVVAGTYGDEVSTIVITVDGQGRLTFANTISLSNNFISANSYQSLSDFVNNSIIIIQSEINNLANTKYDKTGGLISGQIDTSDQFIDAGSF